MLDEQESSQPADHRPPSVDLDLWVTRTSVGSQVALSYHLYSPSGAVSFHHHEIPGHAVLDSEEKFRDALLQQLQRLEDGFGPEYEPLTPADLDRQLEDLGRWLYRRLFPDQLQAAYRKFRRVVKTLQITSDIPWIPWELIIPYDNTDPEALIDDDFLGMKFQLTRWIAGPQASAMQIRVNEIAVLDAGEVGKYEPLQHRVHEREMVLRFGSSQPELKTTCLIAPRFRDVEHLLREATLGVLHFVGHGDFGQRDPDQSKIMLADQPLRAINLSGPLGAELKRGHPLVFFNACHAGRQGFSWVGLGGWPRTLILDCGCGAFVAPQWAISDELAFRFAEAFYAALGQGDSLGQAMQAARLRLRALAPGQPTALAYAVYAHPNARLDMGSAPVAGPRYISLTREIPDAIRGQLIDNSLLIDERAAGFVGRGWLFELIDRFLTEKPGGYFLLEGDPGIGKSAVLAELVRRKGYLHHFNVRATKINRVGRFLGNVCAQLIARYGLGYTHVSGEALLDGNFLTHLLQEAAERERSRGGKVILVVDALDEVEPKPKAGDPNVLYLPSVVPTGVYVIASRRIKDPPVRIDSELWPFELTQDVADNVADVETFVTSQLVLPGIRRYISAQAMDEKSFVLELVQKSQGNFMYLRHVIPAIAEGSYSSRDFSTLPVGLINYYEDHWSLIRRRNEETWFSYKLPVLLALAVAQEPVSVDLISEFSGIGERARIFAVLEEWAQFLYLTDARDDDDRPQKRYRLYHASFQEFIAAKDEVEAGVSLRKAHGKIADVLWEDLFGDSELEPES